MHLLGKLLVNVFSWFDEQTHILSQKLLYGRYCFFTSSISDTKLLVRFNSKRNKNVPCLVLNKSNMGRKHIICCTLYTIEISSSLIYITIMNFKIVQNSFDSSKVANIILWRLIRFELKTTQGRKNVIVFPEC